MFRILADKDPYPQKKIDPPICLERLNFSRGKLERHIVRQDFEAPLPGTRRGIRRRIHGKTDEKLGLLD